MVAPTRIERVPQGLQSYVPTFYTTEPYYFLITTTTSPPLRGVGGGGGGGLTKPSGTGVGALRSPITIPFSKDEQVYEQEFPTIGIRAM